MTLPQRIAALEGPDRAVDAEVAVALGWQRLPDSDWFTPPNLTVRHHISELPRWTASLDAAMSVVPEGCLTWHTGKHLKTSGGIGYIVMPGVVDPFYVVAATPALALLSAAMQARGL